MRFHETSDLVVFESAKLSLAGDRQENQDRVEIFSHTSCALIVVVDGMGGHAEGSKASEMTVTCIKQRFGEAGHPIFDPQGFLTAALTHAHERVVEIGEGIALEHRPRATCALCLVQDGCAYWAHIGDSRIYQVRDSTVVDRSRDHSHVEVLLREGLIAERDMKNHPMRNFVECCLGGDQPVPDMSISGRKRLKPNDVLLVCTDGLWSGVDDAEIAALSEEGALDVALAALAKAAVSANSPHSDNTSAAALRWRGG
jgi:serine/threonine protein phosphatase PrpC